MSQYIEELKYFFEMNGSVHLAFFSPALPPADENSAFVQSGLFNKV